MTRRMAAVARKVGVSEELLFEPELVVRGSTSPLARNGGRRPASATA
jgi:hypothetical protein